MDKMKMQFSIYMMPVRVMSIIFVVIFILNVILSRLAHTNTSFMVTAVFAMVIAASEPVVNLKLMQYFFSFGMGRREYYKNTVIFNVLLSLSVSVIETAVYFLQGFINGSKSVFADYMGIIPSDPGIDMILAAFLLHFGMFAAISGTVALICSVFLSSGKVYGISSVLIVLSIPLFLYDKIIEFFMWGGTAAAVGSIFILTACIARLLAWVFLSRIEFSN